MPKSMISTGIIAAVLFVFAHFAMLIGVTTPENFYFDEVHYVPAARQMLEPVMPQPMLNPMHPPLAKQFIALSIHSFGDGPLGWRYPGVLSGSLAIVAVYLCGLALFAAQGPAIASGLLAFFNQMLFVQSRIAMLDIFGSPSACSPSRRSCMAFESSGRICGSRLPVSASACRSAANGAGCSCSRSASSSSQ